MSSKRWALGIGTLLIVTLAAYIPAMGGQWLLDDDLYVVQNQDLHSVGGLLKIWTRPRQATQYYPLVFTTYWIEQHFWGVRPAGYHVVNILLHAANAILFWLVLRRLDVPGGWFAAVIFALHPVHVETVAWVAERKNTLSMLFFLLSLLSFLRYWCPRERATDGQESEPSTGTGNGSAGSRRFYVLGLLFFICSLLSKSAACILPVIVLILLWWKRGNIRWRDIVLLIPLFVVSLASGVVTIVVERAGGDHHLQLTLGQRILVAGKSFWFYLGKLLWPTDLMGIYPRWSVSSVPWWHYLFAVSTVVCLLVLWRMREKIGRWPVAGMILFTVAIGPALGFCHMNYFDYHSFVADHFQYMPSLAPLAMLGAGLAWLFHRIDTRIKRVTVVASVPLILGLGYLTWRQEYTCHSLETFFRRTLQGNPDSWMAHYFFALDDARNERIEQGMAHFHEAWRLNPGYLKFHNSMGKILLGHKRYDEALIVFSQVLVKQPDQAEANSGMGSALMNLGREDEAFACFHHALQKDPAFSKARYNLAQLLINQGEYTDAVRHFEKLVADCPDQGWLHKEFGVMLCKMGRFADGVGYLSRAVTLDPDNKEFREYRDSLFSMKDQVTRDIALYQSVVRSKPDNAKAHYQLGTLLETSGNRTEAIKEYREALRITPQWSQVMGKLAWLLATHDDTRICRPEESVRLAEEACKLCDQKSPELLDALAASYAANARFLDAEETARKAVDVAISGGNKDLAQEIEKRLRLYRKGRPYRLSI